MSTFSRIIGPDNVLCDIHVRSKKHCLDILSGLLARCNPEVAEEEIFANLIERERLGCTAVGNGMAFPHCRVSGAGTSTGALLRLAEPVEFEAPDGVPVDLVLGLLVPAELDATHQADIKAITQLLGDEQLRARLRDADTPQALYDALATYAPEAARRSLEARG